MFEVPAGLNRRRMGALPYEDGETPGNTLNELLKKMLQEPVGAGKLSQARILLRGSSTGQTQVSHSTSFGPSVDAKRHFKEKDGRQAEAPRGQGRGSCPCEGKEIVSSDHKGQEHHSLLPVSVCVVKALLESIVVDSEHPDASTKHHPHVEVKEDGTTEGKESGSAQAHQHTQVPGYQGRKRPRGDHCGEPHISQRAEGEDNPGSEQGMDDHAVSEQTRKGPDSLQGSKVAAFPDQGTPVEKESCNRSSELSSSVLSNQESERQDLHKVEAHAKPEPVEGASSMMESQAPANPMKLAPERLPAEVFTGNSSSKDKGEPSEPGVARALPIEHGHPLSSATTPGCVGTDASAACDSDPPQAREPGCPKAPETSMGAAASNQKSELPRESVVGQEDRVAAEDGHRQGVKETEATLPDAGAKTEVASGPGPGGKAESTMGPEGMRTHSQQALAKAAAPETFLLTERSPATQTPVLVEETLSLILGWLRTQNTCGRCARALTPLMTPLMRLVASPRRWTRTRALQVLALLASLDMPLPLEYSKTGSGAAETPANTQAISAGQPSEQGVQGPDAPSGVEAMQVDEVPDGDTADKDLWAKDELVAGPRTLYPSLLQIRRMFFLQTRCGASDPMPVVRTAALEAMTRLLSKELEIRSVTRNPLEKTDSNPWATLEVLMASLKDSVSSVRKAAVHALTYLALCFPEAPWKESPPHAVSSSGSLWAGVSERHVLGLPTVAFLCLSELSTDMNKQVRLLAFAKVGLLKGLVHPGYLAQGFFKRLRTGQADADLRAHGGGEEHGSPGMHEWAGGEGDRGGHSMHEDKRPVKKVKCEVGEDGTASDSKHTETEERRPPQEEYTSPLRSVFHEVGEVEVKKQEKELRLLRERAAGAFIHGMEDSSKDIRIAVLRSFGDLITQSTLEAAEEALPHILDEVSDETPAVRLEALFTLMRVLRKWGKGLRLGDSDRISPPAAAMSDSLPAVRSAARRLLSHISIGSKQALLLVRDLLFGAVSKWPDELDEYLTVAVSLGQGSAAAVEASICELLAQAQGMVQQIKPGLGSAGDSTSRGYALLLCMLLSAARSSPMCIRPQIPETVLQHYPLFLPNRFLRLLAL